MKNNAKKTKKLLPLAVLLAAAALLGILLAVLTRSSTDAADTTIPLCGFTAEEIDRLAYSGNNMDVTLLKGSTGDWMLDSDPALPLDQAKVASLVEQYAALAALLLLTFFGCSKNHRKTLQSRYQSRRLPMRGRRARFLRQAPSL